MRNRHYVPFYADLFSAGAAEDCLTECRLLHSSRHLEGLQCIQLDLEAEDTTTSRNVGKYSPNVTAQIFQYHCFIVILGDNKGRTPKFIFSLGPEVSYMNTDMSSLTGFLKSILRSCFRHLNVLHPYFTFLTIRDTHILFIIFIFILIITSCIILNNNTCSVLPF